MTTPPLGLSPSRTTCDSLLNELQIIWDEIGESDSERDKMLQELEQECLDIYRRKVTKTKEYKTDLQQQLADTEIEMASLISELGESSFISRERGTLKEQISARKVILDGLRLKKEERLNEFLEVQSQVVSICAEIASNDPSKNCFVPQENGGDLTVKKLGELKTYLKELQTEKVLRIHKVKSHLVTIHALSNVMSTDFLRTVERVHPSLGDLSSNQSMSISNDTLARLTGVVNSLKQEKKQRLEKLQSLGRALQQLWNLMDVSVDEQKEFEHVSSLLTSSVDELSTQGCLGQDVIQQVEIEVERLNILKASKMKELVFKRQDQLEQIYRVIHIDVDTDPVRCRFNDIIDSGNADLSDLLSTMDDQIAKANEQALSRKDILDKVEKWQFASHEEKWLDDYEKDENRYIAGRGAHKNLKRAEKARILVSKIPSIVENLSTKVKAWEVERGMVFLYGKVPLLQMLEEYIRKRWEREEEKRKFREQKRLQEQLAVEQESLFGSRPVAKKPLGQITNTNTMMGTPGRRLGIPGRQGVSSGKQRRESGKVISLTPVNYVALPKEDSVTRGH